MIYSTTFAVLLFVFSGHVQARAKNLIANPDPDCEIQQYWPDIYNCSRFYECDAAGEKEARECAEGTLWNQPEKTCDIPANTDCSWTVTPGPSTTPATTPTPTSPSTTVDPWRCPVDGEFFPDSGDCRGFYECKNGKKQHNYCTVPLLWNVTVVGCSTSSDCSQVVTTTELTPTTQSCYDGEFKIDPKDCHQFYYCDNYSWQGPSACPADLYWSEHQKACVKKPESDCK